MTSKFSSPGLKQCKHTVLHDIQAAGTTFFRLNVLSQNITVDSEHVMLTFLTISVCLSMFFITNNKGTSHPHI
jgi:hypothetical protein